MEFKIDDSVRFKDGFVDEETKQEMAGWQGRIKEIYVNDVALVEFDSVTLHAIPGSYIEDSEECGLSWSTYRQEIEWLEVVEPRDQPSDVVPVVKARRKEFSYSHLGPGGHEINEILRGTNPKSNTQTLQAWYNHLSKTLTFPFEAEVDEVQERGPFQAGDQFNITGFDKTHRRYGVIVKVQHNRKKYRFPLSDLEVTDESSPNHELVALYSLWYSNR